MKLIYTLVILLVLSFNVYAIEATVQWDVNTDADYYVVYWGETSGDYTNNSENINKDVTTFTVTGLEDKLYYFAVKAFNSCGNSSDFSDEVTNKLVKAMTGVSTQGCFVETTDNN